MVGHLRIGGYAVRQELVLLATGNAANLITAKRHSTVIAVRMCIAVSERQQVETAVAVAAASPPSLWPPHDNILIAEVAWLDKPDAAEVEVNQFHAAVGDSLELLRSRRKSISS